MGNMNQMKFEIQRKAMVDSQIRPNKVFEDDIIAAFSTVPREVFVPKQLANIAYVDEDIALSGGRYIIEAMVMARLFQSFELDGSQNVMVVASSTGYGAAVISHLVSSVIAIETRAQMVEKAQQNVSDLGISNVAFVKSRLQDGFESEGPYHAIFIEGGIEVLPDALTDQLADGGRLAAVMRQPGSAVGDACIWQKNGQNITQNRLFTAQTPVLDEFKAKPKFTF